MWSVHICEMMPSLYASRLRKHRRPHRRVPLPIQLNTVQTTRTIQSNHISITMAMKRKRSSFEDSPESVNSYDTNMSESPSPTTTSTQSVTRPIAPYVSHRGDLMGWSATGVTASDAPSRTRKRWRNNRPDESQVHRTFRGDQ